MARGNYTVVVTGVDDLQAALLKANMGLVPNNPSGEIYQIGMLAAETVAIPALKTAARGGMAPPQAKFTAENLASTRGQFPAAEFQRSAGFFRAPKSGGDDSTYSAIYGGSIRGGRYFGGPAGPWIETTVRSMKPAVVGVYKRGLGILLRKVGLI